MSTFGHTDGLDLSTPEAAQKALHDIHAEQKRLADSNRSLKENLEAKSADIAKISKALGEANERAKLATSQIHADNEINRYISDDKIRWVAETRSNGVVIPGLLDETNERTVCDWQRDFKSLMEQRTMVKMLTKRGESPKTDAQISHLMTTAPEPIKRILSDTAAAGAEWIPDIVVSNLGSELYGARRVESLFQTWALPGKEMRVPFLTLGTTPYIASVPSSDDPSQFTASTDVTAQRSITCDTFKIRTQVDEDATEDSLVPMLGTIRTSLIAGMVDAFEDGLINGDAATSHMDDIANWNPRSRWSVGAVGPDHRHSFTGLRGRAYDVSNTTDQSSAKTYAGFLTARASLDSPHGTNGDLICIVSPEYYTETMLGLTEVTGLDKMGTASPLLSGQLASLGGVPIIVSEFVPNDYAADGMYDNVTKNTTGFLILNRSRWFVGTYKNAIVELDKDITRGVINLVSSMRKTLFHLDSTTKKQVHWSFNL